MARRSKRNSGKPSAVRQQTALDPGSFRRLIHAQGNLAVGINTHRGAIPLEAIDTVVRTLMPNPVYRGLLAPDPFPRTHARVRGGKYFRILSAEHELIWAASIVSHFAAELTEYLRLKDTYSGLFLNSAFAQAKEVLNEIEEKFGLSIWLTNAQLSLSHVADGLSAQKALLNRIIATPSIDPLYAYVLFLSSHSLEESVTLAEVRREFVEPSDIRDYAVYHVSPFDFDNIAEPQNCIGLEATSPIIDRFETLADIMLLLHVQDQCRQTISQAANLLRKIDDHRIRSLNFQSDTSNVAAHIDPIFLSACDDYTLGNYPKAANTIATLLQRNSETAWALELAARNDTALEVTRAPITIADRIISETQSFLDVSKDLASTRDALLTLGFQTRKLPASRAIAALLDRVLDLPITDRTTAAQGIFCFSAPLVQPAHYGIIKHIDPSLFDRLKEGLGGLISPAHKLAMTSIAPTNDAEALIREMQIPLKRASLYLAYGAYNQGDYHASIAYFAKYGSISPDKTSPRTLTFQYALNKRQRLLREALRAFVEAYFTNPRSRSLYSIDEFTGWAISNAAADETAIDRAILLHVYSTYFSSAHDGDLSDALEDALDHFHVSRPSELIGSSLEKRRLVYILRYVANIERLEDTTRFVSIDEIEAERITILQWLVQHDQANRAAFTAEISSITKDQEVARLSAQFERSKIYVHEDGIKRNFETEIKQQFFRYRQLLSDPDIVAQLDQIEQRLRKLLKESDHHFYLLIPSTERDSIYFSMIQRAYDILVLDPNHGFKTYLSTRILHGILEGELRASFVNEGLLVSADGSAKEHQFLERWSDRLVEFDELEKLEIAKDVVKFSERVTQAISILKDRRIRIFSKDHPEGLFAISLSDDAFYRLKQSLTSTTTYDEFVERLIQSFWDSVELCLRAVKIEIGTRFRRQILTAFDGLETTLTQMKSGARPSQLLDAIVRCRTSFDFNLKRVSAWFSRAGVMTPEPFLASTAIRVAARITNNCYPQYPLDVIATEIRYHEISGEFLNPLVDLLTNCFQNAAEHSGIEGRAPLVSVTISSSSETGLRFEVTSELSESIDQDACRAEITELLLEGDVSNSLAVAGEGRTGIRKMKRIIRHDFQSDGKLCMTVLDNKVFVSFAVPWRYVRERAHH